MKDSFHNEQSKELPSITRVLSSDSHIIEPPDLWVARVDKKFKHVAPTVERIDGSDWWIYKGEKIGSVSGRKKRSGGNLKEASVSSNGAVLTHSVFDDVIPAAYTPDLYLQENLKDGVVGMVIRPTQGITNYCVDDSQLFTEICKTYNDWMIEFCSQSPANLKGVAMLNNYDPDEAVKEIARVKHQGMVGGIISVYPGADKHYGLPMYDKLWAAACEHEFALSFHVLTNHNGPYGVNFAKVNYSLRANAEYWVRLSLSDMIFNGVFDRFPSLQIESSEHEGAWVPYFKWQMDWIYHNRIIKRRQVSPMNHAPSHYLGNNVHISLIYDRLAVEQRYEIGVDRIMWGSDFPHEQSTLPNSLKIAAQIFSGVPAHEQHKMLLENTATLYGFDLNHPCLQVDALSSDQAALSEASQYTAKEEALHC